MSAPALGLGTDAKAYAPSPTASGGAPSDGDSDSRGGLCVGRARRDGGRAGFEEADGPREFEEVRGRIGGLLKRVERPCVVDGERADAEAGKRGQAAAGVEPQAEVADERADVGAAAAAHLEVDGRKVVGMKMQPVYMDGAGFEFERLAAAGAFVGGDAADLDGADVGRNLLDRALEREQSGTEFVACRRSSDGDGYEWSVGVEAFAGDVEAGGCAIDLGLIHDAFDEFGGAAHAQDEDTGSAGVERAGVTAFSLAGDRADLVEGLGRRDAHAFVEVDDPVHGEFIARGRRRRSR